jgi:hypothetical protein
MGRPFMSMPKANVSYQQPSGYQPGPPGSQHSPEYERPPEEEPPPPTQQVPTQNKKSFWGEPQAVAAVIAAVVGAIAAIVVALIGSGVIRISPGNAIERPTSPPIETTSSKPLPTVPTTTPITRPTTTTPVVSERKSTESSEPLTLSYGYSADLDALTPAWDVQYSASNARFDIKYMGGAGIGGVSASDFAVVTGPASYTTCLNATGYTRGIPRHEMQPGVTACVRTSEKRLAFITISKLIPRDSPRQVQLDLVVWDPPFEE